MVPLYFDHHVDSAISEGLRKRGVDVLTCHDDGTAAWDDECLCDRAMLLALVIGSIATLALGNTTQDKDAKDGKDKDFAAELPRIAPKSPADAVKTFKLAPGFKIELVASEPALRSPVAVDFDEDGRMYV